MIKNKKPTRIKVHQWTKVRFTVPVRRPLTATEAWRLLVKLAETPAAHRRARPRLRLAILGNLSKPCFRRSYRILANIRTLRHTDHYILETTSRF